ncbi:MAG: hypothetical protein ACX939_09525 [Hyphococcus sp.]
MSKNLSQYTTALYSAISGPSGKCDWDGFRKAFRPGARLIRVNEPGTDDSVFGRIQVMSVDEYIENTGPKIEPFDFAETETGHVAEIIGDTASVRSEYAARLKAPDGVHEWSGVNFIHFVHDAVRWRIVSIIWDAREARTQ